MSKIRFDLKKLVIPTSLRLAARVLQRVDSLIHESAAKYVVTEVFARGREQGFSLFYNDREREIYLRAAFAQEYNSDRIVIFYAPSANTADFMRQLTAFKNNEKTPLKAAYFSPDEILEAAQFVCDFFDDLI